MANRKRDSFGRFSSSGGTDLARFGRESEAYKKPRNMGVQPSMPSYPGAVGAMSVSGQAPPSASALGVSYSSGVIDLGSNSTSSVAVQAKPWSAVTNIPPTSPGALLFVQRDGKLAKNGTSRQIRSIADLPTMNWLLKHSRDNLANLADETSRMSAGSYAKEGGLKTRGGWNFLGPLRNKYQQGSSGIITLMNVDVFGRSKIACIFGSRIHSGDRLGLALVPVNLTKFPSILGPGSKSTVTADYVDTLLDDQSANTVTAGMLSGATESAVGKKFTEKGEYHVWQYLPTVNGVICKFLWDLFDEKEPVKRGWLHSGAPKVDFVDYIALGCVSNAQMSRRCNDRVCRQAVFDTDRYTVCPQVEILIE